MSLTTRALIVFFLLAFSFSFMYLVFYTKHELVGFLGFAIMYGIHLLFKNKAKPEWSKA